jgi:uncharacterized protein (TIGR03437 family)
MNTRFPELPKTFKTRATWLFQVLSVTTLGLALAAPVGPALAQEADASLTITHIAPTRRLNESMMLGFGGPELVDSASYLRNTIVPGGRATLLFADAQGENFTPNCIVKSAPYPTTLCGAKVVITYTFSSDSDLNNQMSVNREAQLISVNAFDENRIDLIVPNLETNVPNGFSLISAVVSLELNGKRNNPDKQENFEPTPSIPQVVSIPTIFVDYWGRPKITRPNGSQISESNPAKPGERVTVWGTGFGEIQPTGMNTPNLNDWKATVNDTDVKLTAQKDAAGAIETLQFIVPESAKSCEGGSCLLGLLQDPSLGHLPTEVNLYVNTPPQEIIQLQQIVRGIDYYSSSDSGWSGESGSTALTPGSFATAQLKSDGCAGYLQGALAQSFPKPTKLCGVKFLFRADGSSQAFEAPLYSLRSKTAIFQVPMEMSGAQRGTVSVSVNGREVSTFPIDSFDSGFIAQGLLTLEEGSALQLDSVIRPGDILDLFGFGLGQTTPAIATNTPGGDENQFPSLTMTIIGGDLKQPLPVEILSAAKKARVVAEHDSFEIGIFQSLESSIAGGYYGPVLRDWVRFTVPSTLNSGKYSLKLCQNGTCSATPPFRVEKEQTVGQLCVLVKRSNRNGSNANLSGVTVSDAYGLGSGITDRSGQMCFGSAPTGTKYLVSAKKAGFTFLNRKLAGTINEGSQVAELTAFVKENAKKKRNKQKKSKKKGSGKTGSSYRQ